MSVKASVIIAVYNAAETIRRCVESLVFGKQRDIEIVLVEDCSADDSWEICMQLAKEFENVRCIQNEKNSGVSYTRNQGLKVASGEFILFVDSDDWVSADYISVLTRTAKDNMGKLVLCGYQFINCLSDRNISFLYDKNYSAEIEKSQFFSLVNTVLMQQLWNKIFRLDVIREHGLRFDVNQSMGEDFQFVLDYMKASAVESCLVVNQPLYYYVRANNTSLMSKMGQKGYEASKDRLMQLAALADLCDSQEYVSQVRSLQKNYQYQTVRMDGLSRQEKLQRIESFMHDGDAAKYYKQQKAIIRKENLVQRKNDLIGFRKRVEGWLQRKKRGKLIKSASAKLRNRDFTIISQNCIGGVFYHDMEAQFLSPTINLYLCAEDFVKLVLNLKDYISSPIEMEWGETYPVGKLKDIELRFMHYHSCTEAMDAWERRKKRINWNKIIVVSTDREGFDETVYTQWKKIPYSKVLFTAQKRYAQEPNTVYYPQYEKNGMVPDLIPDREFYQDGVLVDTVNSLAEK